MRLEHNEDIILGKLANIQENLNRIEQVSQSDTSLTPWMVEDLYALYLQRAVESCIDITNHLIAENNWSTPSSASEAFEILCEHDVFEENFINTLISMVGFRNIAVHAYGTLDSNIVRDIVENHLTDFQHFARRITELTIGK